MKKTILFLIPFLFIIQNIISMKQGGFNMSGAPGEGTCTGCHPGVANADPNGKLEITIDGNPSVYKPDSIYQISLTSSYTGKTRFGFTLNARKKGIQFIGVGQFQQDTASGLRIFDEIVTHTDTTIDAIDSKTWKMKWKAPSTNQGIITFYSASVIANADNSNNGDVVVTDSLSLGDINTGLQRLNQPNNLFSLTSSQTHILIKTIGNRNYTLQLYSINGNLVSTHYFNETLQLDKVLLHKGIYLVWVSDGKNQHVEKFIITN